MSLLKRVERAQRGPGDPSDSALVPVAPAAPAPPRGPGRGEQIGDIRLQLQREVIAAFSDAGGCRPEGHPPEDGGDRRPGDQRG